MAKKKKTLPPGFQENADKLKRGEKPTRKRKAGGAKKTSRGK